MTIEARKKLFLEKVEVSSPDQAIGNSLRAAFRRNPTYAAPQDRRGAFQAALGQELEHYLARHRDDFTEDEHNTAIVEIADRLSRQHADVLLGGCLRIGTAQKALNVYLKIMWCLCADLPTPPHCPVDRGILVAAGIYANWTQLNSIDIYRQWIGRIQDHAERMGYRSIAEWELCTWEPDSSVVGKELPTIMDPQQNVVPRAERMRTPPSYVGCWTGMVHDTRRVHPYPARIELTEDGGHSIYNMTMGNKEGFLSNPRESGGCLVMYEDMPSGGVSGALSFRLQEGPQLLCRWQNGSAATLIKE